MTPEAFRQVSKGKAVNTIVARLLELEGKKPFPPTADFFRLRSFFSKQDHSSINVLYDYLATLDSTKSCLADLFVKAELYRQEQQISKKEAKQYDEITLEDVMKL